MRQCEIEDRRRQEREEMTDDWQQVQRAYTEAVGWFQATTARIDGRWDEPGLGEWDVRALVGHTSRSLVTVETYLAQPALAAVISSAVAYYQATRALSSGPGVAQRGREAGRALGDDPVAAVAELAGRVLAFVEGLSGDEVPTTIAGGMLLRHYLVTRVFELTVHTADLARALGLPTEPPALPASITLKTVCDLAVADGRAGQLLLHSTGRGLPEGFTVL
jgi:uncharacterized protein (TIGR03083 family)